MGRGRCDQCGEEHEELEPGFHRPDAVFAVPEEERADRVRESDDLVSIDGEAFFIRCVAPIPVRGREEPYRWGFWVKVAREDFEAYRRTFDGGAPADHPGFRGTLANQSHVLPPTLGLEVHVHLGRGRQRPSLMLLDGSHVLTRAQEIGVVPAVIRAWSERCAHGAPAAPPDESEPEPAPTLEEEGWRLLHPGEVGRVAEALAAPPAPGDLVKASFAFLAAGPHGELTERTEHMWVQLDAVREDGWWGGTLDNQPFVPGPLAAGTRVWLRAEHVLAFLAGAPAAPGAGEAGAQPAAKGRVSSLRRWLRRVRGDA
ncbi:DUF2199 domain-containing protein [Anaeromyxobacter sp. Red801]|uniref:DUF2199 domain-containing protein n=1 Tax=Anaeromyxobacter sp. Red801 TaxID=3411632 RepID=UPI003B9EBB77